MDPNSTEVMHETWFESSTNVIKRSANRRHGPKSVALFGALSTLAVTGATSAGASALKQALWEKLWRKLRPRSRFIDAPLMVCVHSTNLRLLPRNHSISGLLHSPSLIQTDHIARRPTFEIAQMMQN